METRAIHRFARISPRKVRLVADVVRGMDVPKAVEVLKFAEKRAAPMLSRVIISAVSNAKEKKASTDEDKLFVKTILVDGGPTMRRWLPRAHGRATRLRKRTAHITVVLDERD